MKKKLISALLALTMVFALAACGSKEPTPSESQAPAIPDALTILTTVWATYTEDEKFPAAGGDYDHMTDDAPGAFDITNTENVSYLLSVPEDQVSKIDDAASLMHMMNGNTFTCGAFHIANTDDVAAFATAMRDGLQNKQWMCGFPDKLVVADLGGGYVVALYGAEDLVNTFRDKLQTSFESTTLTYDEAINF